MRSMLYVPFQRDVTPQPTSLIKKMELESAVLEVASRHWRQCADDACRKLRNHNRRLQREKTALLSRLQSSLTSERRFRQLAIQLQQQLLSIRRGLRELADRSF